MLVLTEVPPSVLKWGSSLLLSHLAPDRDEKRGLNFVLSLINPDSAFINRDSDYLLT